MKESYKAVLHSINSRVTSLKNKALHIDQRLHRFQLYQIVVRTVQEMGADDASHMAAGVAYYAILSLFPLLIGLIAIFGLIVPADTVIDFFDKNLPGLADAITDNIDNIKGWRATFGIVGLLALLWSASAMFGAITRAVNRAWDVHEDRPFYVRKLHDIILALGTGLLFLLSLGASSIFSIFHELDLPFANAASDIGARIFAVVLSFTVFMIVYKFTPNTKTYWKYIWPGAVLAAVLFEFGKTIFVLYLDRFANYDSVYGSLGSVIVVLVWIYISALILILGAEFSSEFERVRRGTEKGRLVTHVLMESRDDTSLQ